MYPAIVLMPLAGAFIAGFFGRILGDRASGILTSLLVLASAVLSWYAFYQVGIQGEDARITLMPWIGVGDLQTSWALRIDTLTAVMLVVVNTVSALVHFYSIGYMHDDDRQPLLFRRAVAVHVRDALARDRRQLRPDVLRLGRRRPRLLPAHRLLVSPASGELSRDQGVRRQPRRRFRLRARHLRRFLRFPRRQLRHGLRCSPREAKPDADRLRLSGGRADRDLPAALHGRDGQIGAVPAPHLATRRDGRPDAGLRTHPRRHHGDGGRVHGGPAFAAVRAFALRTLGRHARGCHHRVLRGHHWRCAKRHQARDRLFDLLPAWLHVRGTGLARLSAPASSTFSRTPSSRRCCSWGQAPSSTPCTASRTCGKWADCARRYRSPS